MSGIYDRQLAAGGLLAASGVAVPGTSGNDTIAGDAIGDVVALSAEAGNAQDNVPGIDGEVIKAFNDSIAGFDGRDELIGDVFAMNGGDVRLSVNVGVGGRNVVGGNEARALAFDDRMVASWVPV